jgi:hypothetical protein
MSVLVGAAGAFVVVICMAGLVTIPQQVTENPPPSPGREAGAATALVVFPLVVSTGVLAGILLLWAGVRGVRSAADPPLWCRRQRTALWSCLVGGLLALFIFAFADAPWTGLMPGSRRWGIVTLIFYSALAFLLIIVLSLQEEERPLRAEASRASGRDARGRYPPDGGDG